MSIRKLLLAFVILLALFTVLAMVLLKQMLLKSEPEQTPPPPPPTTQPTPQSKGVLYSRRGKLTLYSEGKLTTLLENKDLGDFRVSSDRTKIAYITPAKKTNGQKEEGRYGAKLFLYDLVTKQTTEVYAVANPKPWKGNAPETYFPPTYDRITLYGFAKDGSVLFWHKDLYAYKNGEVLKRSGISLTAKSTDLHRMYKNGARVVGDFILESGWNFDGVRSAIYKLDSDLNANPVVLPAEIKNLGNNFERSNVTSKTWIPLKIVNGVLKLAQEKGRHYPGATSDVTAIMEVDLNTGKIVAPARTLSWQGYQQEEFGCPIYYNDIVIKCNALNRKLPKAIKDQTPYIEEWVTPITDSWFVFLFVTDTEIGFAEHRDGKLSVVDYFKFSEGMSFDIQEF